MSSRVLTRLRRACLTLPEAHEVEAWGAPTFRVRNKLFAMYSDGANHHGRGRDGVWCKATPENQEWMVRSAPDRYFVPPYVGKSGWIGVYLDAATDWKELSRILADGYRAVAPNRLLAVLDGQPATAAASRGRPRARSVRTTKK